MKNINQPTRGKILIHGKGSGGITGGDLERRAREIAFINGHSPEAVNEADRDEARDELNGESLPPTTGDDIEVSTGLNRDPSDPPSDRGHQIPNLEGPDEQKAVERLAAEGVEEAQHDQMLAARRQQRREEKKM